MKLPRTGRRAPTRNPIGTAAPSRGRRRRADAARPIGRGRRRLRWPFGRLRLTPPRAAAILGLLASIGGLYGLATTPAFTLARTELPELSWTATDAVRAKLATPDGTNLFQIRTRPIEDRLQTLPAVADAHVRVSLPDTLVVEIRERVAILAWAVGDTRLLVDTEGVIFATVAADSLTMADLPTIADTRPEAAALAVGSVINAVDLDAARRLGSLSPVDLGSAATSLVTTVNEANGFVIGTVPRSWIAVFGLYTPTLRSPAMIPEQVRVLRSLLVNREPFVAKVILADADSGTVVLKEGAAP